MPGASREMLLSLFYINLPNSGDSKAAKNFNWTDETINLVELAYGLYLTGQFNDGKPVLQKSSNGCKAI